MKSLIAATCAILFLAGCSGGIKVHTDSDPDWNFSGYSTWNWRNAEAPPSDDPRLNDPGVRDEIRSEVIKTLAARGYTRDTANPDFLVQVQAHVDDKVYSAPNWSQPDYRETDQWADGFLSISIRDTKEDLLVWQGGGKSKFDPNVSRTEKLAQVDELVEAILAKFPPKK